MYTKILLVGVFLAGNAYGETLFDKMGGAPKLHATVEEFTRLLIEDPRTNFTFADADMPKFKGLLYDQFCSLTGGPCVYKGRDMKTSHEKLHLNTAEFNALAEDLYKALDHVGVPYRLQNKLMAILAPMQKDIVHHQ